MKHSTDWPRVPGKRVIGKVDFQVTGKTTLQKLLHDGWAGASCRPSRAAFFCEELDLLLAVSLFVVFRAFVDVMLTILQHSIDQSGER